MRTEDSHSLAAETADGETPQPTRFGHYRVESALGQGGMGEVLLAWDERLERHVAIKRIRSDRPLDDHGRLRFQREARAVARLNHPAIVQIFEVLDTDDGECIVMEYVEGHSLAQLLDDGPVELALALRLGGEIADGLRQAHAKGLVHRDLKPGNVIVTPEGRAKILDFGLARSLSGEGGDGGAGQETISSDAGQATLASDADLATFASGGTLTEPGALIGTVHAMSPEQASGRPIDHRSDLFAFGGLLYEMLTGQAPFRGKNLLDTLWRVTNEQPPPLAELAPQTPAELVALVEKLLAKDPTERPEDAGAVAAELDRMLAILTGANHPLLPGMATAADAALMAANADSVSPDGPPRPAIRVLVLTGLVDGSRLLESLGDSRAVEVASRHDRMARDLLARFDGLEIDKRDGIFGLFERPADAVAFALAYHQELDTLAGELELELAARIGIHLGEVFLRRNSPADVARGAKPLEVDGMAKPIAARVMALAGSRQTLLTHGVFDLARRAAVTGPLADPGLRWLAHGTYVSDDAEEPLELYEIGSESFAPLHAPVDSTRTKRVLALGDELTLGWRPAPGQSIPRRSHWVLEERVGEGGFGEVWLARHKSGEERIFKFCFEAARLRGLKREVTLFRLLKEALGHRNDIARILDWNFDEAPYFLEAEYTEGGSLVQWAADQGDIAAVPLATRLDLVAQVAEALAAAHSVGILHKDVKPDNVLIQDGRDGRPWAQLTDFGIGLVTDRDKLESQGVTVMGFTESMGTGEGTSSGTLRYMAPELMAGQPATVQADVYSLGVMLYQLVVGDFSRSVAPGWRREVSDDLLAEDIARFVDGSPERRPASALEVAECLRTLEERRQQREAERRQLEDAEAARQALEKAHRRRRQSLAITAASLVVLAVVSVFAVLAMQARREADRRRGQAEGLIGFMLGDLREKLEAVGSLDVLNEVGDQALEYFAAVPETDLSSREIFRRSQALQQIGRVRLHESRPDDARQAFAKALELNRGLADEDPGNVEWQLGLAERQFWIGRVFWDQGDLDRAAESFQSQLDVVSKLSESDPANLDLRQNLGYAHSNLGFVQKARGDLEGSLAAFRSTLAIQKELADKTPESADLQLTLADQYNLVGEVLMERGHLRTARENLEAGLRIAVFWSAQEPSDTQWLEQQAKSHGFMGRVARALGEIEEAGEYFRRHLESARQLVAIDPANTTWQRHELIASRRLGLLFETRGDLDAANRHVQHSLEVARSLAGKDPTRIDFQRDLAAAHVAVAEVLEARTDSAGAGDHARAALALLEPLLEKNPQDLDSRLRVGQSWAVLARVVSSSGEPLAAAEAWQEAARAVEPIARDSHDVGFLELWETVLSHIGREQDAASISQQIQRLRDEQPS